VLTAATLGLADLLAALGMAYDPLIALILPISTAPFIEMDPGSETGGYARVLLL
jgi:hypothetical protein